MTREVVSICLLLVFGGTATAEMSKDQMQDLFASGMQSVRSGDYQAAIAGFKTMLDEDPNLPRVRLELARAYMLDGQRMAAAREFKTVSKMDLPELVREKVDRYLDRLNVDPKMTIDAEIGYLWDDNVNVGTDSDIVYLYDLPFQLSDDAKRQSDSAVTAAVALQYVRPLTDSTSWVASLKFDSTDYLQIHRYDFLVGRLYTGLTVRAGKTLWRLPIVADFATLGSDIYSSGVGVRPGFTRNLGDGLFLNASGLAEKRNFPDYWGRTGWLLGGDVSLRKELKDWLSIAGGYQYWREDGKLDEYSADSNVIYVSTEVQLDDTLLLKFAPSFVWRQYDEALAYLSDARDDERLRLPVTLEKKLREHLSVSVGYTWTDNDSNSDLFEYDRNQVFGSLNLTF